MNSLKKSSLITAIAASMALCTAAAVRAQDDNPDRITVMWSDPSRPGLLKINLWSGGIEVKTHGGKDVIIEPRPGGGRRRRAPAESAGLRRIDGGNGPLIVEEENNVMSVSNSAWFSSAGVVVQVPVKTNLTLKTLTGGPIVVDGVEGEIEVTNLNGSVTLNNVAGSVVAHSMNGKVVAVFRQVTENKPMAFTSMNGNIDVTLPSNVKANLKMRTDNGEVYSDFEIERTRPNTVPATGSLRNRNGGQRFELGTNLYGTINTGGPDFDLRTFNGNIFIRMATK